MGGGKLGSFRINGVLGASSTGKCGLTIGGPPLARVLSDGGFVGTGLYSPCFRCCFVLNYGVHYTIKFGRCPILNKIHHEDTKEHEDLGGGWWEGSILQ